MAISTVFTAATFPTHLSSTHPRFPPSPSPTRSFHRIAAATSCNSKDHNSGKTVSSSGKSKTKHTLEITGPNNSWEVDEDDEAMYARCEMPGLCKRGLKLTVENNKVLISGEEVDRDTSFYKEKEKPRKYDGYITFPQNLMKMEQMEADINNGVLFMVVPKLKPEEKKGLFFVKID